MRATMPPVDIDKIPRVQVNELREDCGPVFQGTDERAEDRDLRCPEMSIEEFLSIFPPECVKETFGRTKSEILRGIDNPAEG